MFWKQELQQQESCPWQSAELGAVKQQSLSSDLLVLSKALLSTRWTASRRCTELQRPSQSRPAYHRMRRTDVKPPTSSHPLPWLTLPAYVGTCWQCGVWARGTFCGEGSFRTEMPELHYNSWLNHYALDSQVWSLFSTVTMHLENKAKAEGFLQAPVPASHQNKPIAISDGFQINPGIF